MPPLDSEEKGSGSIRDELMAAFSAAEGKTESTQGAEPVAAKSSTEDSKAESEPKVAAKSVAGTEEKPATTDKAAPADKVTAPAEKVVTADKPIDPPARWTKTQKEWFSKLTPDFQRQLVEKDKEIQADYTRKTQEIAQERMRYNAVEQILAPRRADFGRSPCAGESQKMKNAGNPGVGYPFCGFMRDNYPRAARASAART